jgi:hypothetical protein
MSKSYKTKWIWLELFSICTCLLGICSNLLMNRLWLICEGGWFLFQSCVKHSCTSHITSMFCCILHCKLSSANERKVLKMKCIVVYVASVWFAYKIFLKSLLWLHYWGCRRCFLMSIILLIAFLCCLQKFPTDLFSFSWIPLFFFLPTSGILQAWICTWISSLL